MDLPALIGSMPFAVGIGVEFDAATADEVVGRLRSGGALVSRLGRRGASVSRNP